MRQNNEAIIKRNAKVYTGKKHNYKIDKKVWYLCPRKVKSKPAKLTDEWLGPYKIIERVAEVLYRIEPADYEGPQITVHAVRLLPYRPGTTVKSRIPANLATGDLGDELAEEIRPPRVEEEPRVEMGVPVRLALPEFDIVDLMGGRRKSRPTKQQASSNQIEPDHKPGISPEEKTVQQPDEVQIAKRPNKQAIAP